MSTQNNKKLSFQGSADTPQLKALKKTFCKFKIPSAYYSLAGYSEDAICIERVHNAEWWVYDAERGNKYNKVSYDSLFDACSELIARISESDEEEEKMKINFRHNLYANESLASTLELQRKAIQRGNKLAKCRSDAIGRIPQPATIKPEILADMRIKAIQLGNKPVECRSVAIGDIKLKQIKQKNSIKPISQPNSSDTEKISEKRLALLYSEDT